MAGEAIAPYKKSSRVLDPLQKEFFRQPLYDRVNLGTSLTGDVNFFTTQNGGSATLIRYQTAASVTKTYRDTNLPSQSQDPNKDYMIYGIAMAIVALTRTPAANGVNLRVDKDVIREGGALQIKIGGSKEIFRGPLILLPELNGESSGSTTANNSTVYGSPVYQHRYFPLTDRLGTPFLLEKGTILQCIMTFDGTLTLQQNCDMWLVFDADIRRSI